ncbi:Predicted branched-chain amino acid permease (azaleucine resistance) [Gemmobacter megaterium]|uniref:Predicted branched-chain amino acid permease (Azaleucine resistance) n=2 Tax=Gemmobacter megaterium TaxID=1086013 RepID=A0A1N7M736_9RHOB|nr:Predicted branched-chain amino acid permease (azaleucine resistance) [Gemmobacter megaterium]
MAMLRGMLASAPFLLVIVPFALLFGVVATEAGLNIAEVLGFSLAVFAGAAQFTALQLMQEQAPTLVVLATSLAVNLRMGMYSAALTPSLGKLSLGKRAAVAFFLVDQSYAASMVEFEKRPEMTTGERLAFFAGTVLPVAPAWYIATWIGAVVGAQIPPEFALDFAMPITFIAMTAPMLRTAAHIAAALVSVVGTLALAWMPFSSGVLVAALLAMTTGAMVELWREKRT